MTEAYRIDEGRFLQTIQVTSAADATVVQAGVTVPDGKVWTVIAADYHPSVAETRDVSFYALNSKTTVAHYFDSLSWAFSGYGRKAWLTQGTELRLWPGDELRVQRSAATAGSTMSLRFRFIESDIPLAKQYEIQEERKFASGYFPSRPIFRRTKLRGGGGGPAGGGGFGGGGGGFPGGGGSTPPAR